MEIKASKKKINGSADVAPLFREILQAECQVDANKEHFWVMGLDMKNTVLYLELVSLGGLNQCVVHPREVFRFAIMKGVACLILVHNHPSGDPEPSQHDRDITTRLRRAGDILGIEVLDHIIVGEQSAYYSF